MQLNNLVHASTSHDPAIPKNDAENLLSRLNVIVGPISIGQLGKINWPSKLDAGQFHVLYVVNGQGSLAWRGGSLALRERSIAVVPSQLKTTLHSCAQTHGDAPQASSFPSDGTASDETGDGLVIATSVVMANAGRRLGLFDRVERPLVEHSETAPLAPLFEGMLREMHTPSIGSKCIIESLMKLIVVGLFRRALSRREIITPLYFTVANPNLAMVINKIHDSLAKRLTVPALAKLAGMTPVGLNGEFERVFGESLLDYIQGVRLHQASALLMQTDLPIKSIAASVGFASRSHFSRSFKSRKGEDPTSFRKANLEA